MMYKTILWAAAASIGFFFSAGCSRPGPVANLRAKSLAIDIAGAKYLVDPALKKSGWLNIENGEGSLAGAADELAISTNLTDFSYKQWTHFNSNNIEEIKTVKETDDERVVYIKIKCSEWYQETKSYDVYYLEINLIARKDIPCLFIHQRVRNPTEHPQKINFGNYTSGVSQWGVDSNILKVDPANKAWLNIVKGNCIWIEKATPNKKGLGVILFGTHGFSLFLGHRIFWGYGHHLPVKPGECVEEKAAVMLADNPAEVTALHGKIKDEKFGEFIAP